MIQKYIDRFMAKKEDLRKVFAEKHPETYEEIVRAVVTVILEDSYDDPDPTRIHTIDDGDYQGTLVFVIGAGGYQPSEYWSIFVGYGSCSGCDTLQAVRDYAGWDEPPTEKSIDGYMTLALHIVQSLRSMNAERV